MWAWPGVSESRRCRPGYPASSCTWPAPLPSAQSSSSPAWRAPRGSSVGGTPNKLGLENPVYQHKPPPSPLLLSSTNPDAPTWQEPFRRTALASCWCILSDRTANMLQRLLPFKKLFKRSGAVLRSNPSEPHCFTCGKLHREQLRQKEHVHTQQWT